MRNITNPRLLWIKGAMFLVLAVLAGGLILMETPKLHVALLLIILIWGSCRAYYFAFYVIQNYVDPTYRFSGLGSFLRYAIAKCRTRSR